MVKCCGPKLSIFLILVGVWGIVQLCIMGLFFRLKSPALAMDIKFPEHEKNETMASLKSRVYEAYDDTSNGCFIAAGIYTAVVIGSAINYKCLNMRGNLQ